MAQVEAASDVYSLGVICEAHPIHDANNVFMPYVLNLFAKEKAEMLNQVSPKFEPLCVVRVQKIIEPAITEEDLSDPNKVVFKFLRKQLEKCYTTAPDERFRQYLNALSANFLATNAVSFVHMILTCVSMPQMVNQYRFLV